jgi:2-amino-4-hydroxy-6-hydroxymethyldihydropteridine diphosphokinase
MTRAYVGLSSGADDSPGNVRAGLDELRAIGSVAANSDLYASRPHDASGRPPSYHAVALLETALTHGALAQTLRAIEERHTSGRATGGARGDLHCELVLSSAEEGAAAQVTAHDPAVRSRASLLLPLAEIAPTLAIPPDGTTARELAGRLGADALRAVTRIPGTAHLEVPPALDYDTIGDAGENYRALRPLSRFDRALFDAVARSIGLRPGMRVLDVGCGTGRFSVLLAHAGASVIGLDRSANMLAAAREGPAPANGAVRYQHGDADRALPSGPYDAATLFFSIQYLTLERFLPNLRDVLAPGGAVAVATFPHRHFIETEHARFFPSIPRIDMARFPSVPVLTTRLRAHGFDGVTSCDVVAEEESSTQDLIARTERRYLSTFHLIPQQEFEAGLEAMRAAYAGVTSVRRTIRAVVVSAFKRKTTTT